MERIRSGLRRGEKFQLPAAQAVNGLLGLLQFDPQLVAVFDAWDRETQGLMRGCQAVAIQGSRLCIRVPSAAHRQELIYMKRSLLERLNQALGRKAITDLQFELSTNEPPFPPNEPNAGPRWKISRTIGDPRGRENKRRNGDR